MTANLDGVDTNESGRVYHWSDGESYPSVTTITGSDPEKEERIKEWAQQHPNPEQYKRRQGFLGSVVHHRILNRIATRPLDPPPLDLGDVDDEMWTHVETAEAMWDQLDIDVGTRPRVEEPVRSDEHEYAGRFDLLTGGGTIVDLKISPDIYPSYPRQLSAYFHAIKEMSEYDEPTDAMVVQLNPKRSSNPELQAEKHHFTAFELSNHFAEFMELRRAYDG